MFDITSYVIGLENGGGLPAEQKTVDLDMSKGNQVVTPDAGYTLSAVTVNKPDTMVAENIKKDVDIGGIIGMLSGAVISANPKDVNFYDYDGTCLYAYTIDEIQELAELPPLPTQPGLVCQGWNWTLIDLKAQNNKMNVGAMYITDDGKTRLHIFIVTEGRMDVPLCISQTVTNGVTIDWGDGSPAQTLTGTGYVNTTHTYANIGDYTISLDVAESCVLGFGSNLSGYCVFGNTGNNGTPYCNMLFGVNVGINVGVIKSDAFRLCRNLNFATIPQEVILDSSFSGCGIKYITIPTSTSSLPAFSFSGCKSIENISFPNNFTSLGSGCFSGCNALKSSYLPSLVSSVGGSAFSSCYCVSSITIPENITQIYDNVFLNNTGIILIIFSINVSSIWSNAFSYCTGIKTYDFSKCNSVPTLSSTNAFTGIPPDCKMLIPSILFDTWSTATNWATYANHMIAV